MAKDENLYAQAMEEYESGLIDENLKVKALVLANGITLSKNSNASG